MDSVASAVGGRRERRSSSDRRAAIACLAVLVFIARWKPMFSIFATMLGIGSPIALLIVLQRTQRRRPSVAGIA